MKSFKVKALAVAVLGLAGMGVASAACTNSTPFAAWSSWNGATNTGAAFGGTTVAGNGLNGTSCSMSSSISGSAGNGAEAVVFDNSPQHEQSYRFRFYIDPTAVAANLDSSFKTTYIFQATSQSVHGFDQSYRSNSSHWQRRYCEHSSLRGMHCGGRWYIHSWQLVSCERYRSADSLCRHGRSRRGSSCHRNSWNRRCKFLGGNKYRHTGCDHQRG